MFFKKRVIILFFLIFTINIIEFIFAQYLSEDILTNIDIFVFVIEIFLFGLGVYYFFSYEKMNKRISNKLKELDLEGYSFGKKIDYHLIMKLIAFIESKLANVERKNRELKTENQQLKKKQKVYEMMITQKTEKIAKLYSNLQDQMKKLKTYGRELAKRDKIKENIVAIISHELRSPLFTSLNYLDVLKSTTSDSLSETQKGFVKKVEESLNKIESVITEMVDINNLAIGNYVVKVEYDNFTQSFKMIASQIIERMKSFRNLNFKININIDDIYFYFDKAILRKILNNLISNSCRFTKEGGSVDVNLDKTELNNKNFVKVTVQDTGIGISKLQLYRIFDAFYDAESSDSNILMHSSGKYDFGSKGLGIGLPIVKELVELHGGQIWSYSEGENKGTKFEFIIPIKEKQSITIINSNQNKFE